MSDSDPTTTTTANRTAPVRWPAGKKKASPPAAVAAPPEKAPVGKAPVGKAPADKAPADKAPADKAPAGTVPDGAAAPSQDAGATTAAPQTTPTGPVSRRAARSPSGPLTRMGPWAPVAGGLVGIAIGVVAVVLLAGRADDFRNRLSLVFLVAGMGLIAAGGTLLADEVRMVRWRAREAALRPATWADTTAGLLNGLTPARLLLAAGAFVLFLAAWVPSP
jgi:hypothetical protein